MHLQIDRIITEKELQDRIQKMKELNVVEKEAITYIENKIKNEQAIVTINEKNGKIYEEYKLMKKYGKVIIVPIKINEMNKSAYIESVTNLKVGLFSVELGEREKKIVKEKITSNKDFGIRDRSFYVTLGEDKYYFYLDYIFNNWYRVRLKNALNIEEKKQKEIEKKIKNIFMQ